VRAENSLIRAKIGDYSIVGDGVHASVKRKENGVIYLTSKNFKDGVLDFSDVDYISESDFEKYFKGDSRKLRAREGDVLFSIIGSIGAPYLIRSGDRLGFSSSVAVLRPDSRVLPAYLYYWIRAPNFQKAIYGIKGGVAQSYVSLDMIRSLPLWLPSKDLQRKIVSILSAYDTLIENNIRRIKILEEMAQAIYREWFVHFRFSGHEKVKMVDSQLGKIPNGWEVKRVSDVATIFRGASYRGEHIVNGGGVPFLNLKCINRDGGFRIDGLKQYTGPFKESQTARAGDIIIAVTDMTQERRVVARAARVPRLDADFAVFSMDLVRVESKADMPSDYLYGMFRFSSFPDVVKQRANGVNVLHLSPDSIGSFSFPCPPLNLCREYAGLAGDEYEQRDVLEQKNAILRETRDILLPKLISGEVDLSERDIDGSNNIA
jgi:type I restriction enzyme S subunit